MFNSRMNTGKKTAIVVALMGIVYFGLMTTIYSLIHQGLQVSHIYWVFICGLLFASIIFVARTQENILMRLLLFILAVWLFGSFFLFGGWVYLPAIILLLIPTFMPY